MKLSQTKISVLHREYIEDKLNLLFNLILIIAVNISVDLRHFTLLPFSLSVSVVVAAVSPVARQTLRHGHRVINISASDWSRPSMWAGLVTSPLGTR